MIFSKKDIQEVLPADVTGRSVAHPKRWLVALVRISHEKKVVERVLLPMMIFVHVDMYEQKEVLTLGSISRYMVLRGESTPAVIPDEQMHRFKFMLDYSDEAINMSTTPLSPGTKIKVIKGPLSGLQGELVTVNGKSKVAVRLTMLGCAFVDIPVGCVEPLEK